MAHLKEYKCRGCKEMIYDGNAFCEGCKDKATGIVLGFIEAPTEEVKGDIDYDDLTTYIGEILDYHNYEKLNELEEWLTERFIPKPIEQELIPLDVSKEEIWGLIGKILDAHQQSKSHGEIMDKITIVIQKFLSKYGVQEEDEGITLEEAEEQIKQCTGIDKQYVINDCKTATGSRVHKQEEKAECSTVQNIANERLSTPTPQATSVIDIKKHFEANMLDGEDIDDCGGAMLSAKSVLEYLSSLPIHKKRSEGDIKKYVNPSERDSFDAGKVTGIENFLRDNGLLSD